MSVFTPRPYEQMNLKLDKLPDTGEPPNVGTMCWTTATQQRDPMPRNRLFPSRKRWSRCRLSSTPITSYEHSSSRSSPLASIHDYTAYSILPPSQRREAIQAVFNIEIASASAIHYNRSVCRETGRLQIPERPPNEWPQPIKRPTSRSKQLHDF